jgi:hypothetical protein
MNLELTREQWTKIGTPKDRQQWAKEHPLAYILEFRPQILLPGKGLIDYEPWLFQREFLACRDRFRIINKPRQCGISTTVAAEVAFEFDTVPGAQIVIISKDKDAAVNFHSYVYNVLYSTRRNAPKKSLPKLLKTNERVTTNSIGSKITSLASGKESGRSFSATHLIFDELAFIEYADDIWQAANATLSQTKGRVSAISTPKGRANLFARIFDEPGHMGFTTFNYGWWDVPTYNPYYTEYMIAKRAGDKKAAQEWIQKARSGEWYLAERPKYTDLAWRQEFEGAFDANVGSVFSTRSLERVFRRNTWMPLQPDYQGLGIVTEHYSAGFQPNRIYATGIDLGRKNDPTEFFTYDVTDYDPSERDESGRFLHPARLVDYKHIEPGIVGWSEIEQVAKLHLAEWQPDAQHDGTGSSDGFSEAVDGDSEPFMFTKESKRGIVSGIQHAFDYGAVILPKIPRIYRQHQRYIWDDKDIVQDTVMSNGLAINLFHDGDSDAFVGFKKVNSLSGIAV